ARSLQEELEKVRIDKKKAETRHKEEYETMVSSKNREIDALKLFSKNHSEYVTDMRLLTRNIVFQMLAY
ncbi:hypothetical protein DD924_06325, partial [Staphylococcus pseudintermedius]